MMFGNWTDSMDLCVLVKYVHKIRIRNLHTNKNSSSVVPLTVSVL